MEGPCARCRSAVRAFALCERAGRSNDIWNGVLYTDAWGPQHSLTSVWATWYYNSNSCLNALNSDGSGWAGETYCAWFSDTNVGHPYCGCKLRLGYGFNGGPVEWSHGYWRQFW